MYSKEYAPLKNCRPISQIATNNSHGFQTNPQSHPTSLITVPEIQYVTDIFNILVLARIKNSNYKNLSLNIIDYEIY